LVKASEITPNYRARTKTPKIGLTVEDSKELGPKPSDPVEARQQQTTCGRERSAKLPAQTIFFLCITQIQFKTEPIKGILV